MKIKKIKDKLLFYWGFLDRFIEDGVRILKENDLQSLRLTREYIVEAIKKLESLIK